MESEKETEQVEEKTVTEETPLGTEVEKTERTEETVTESESTETNDEGEKNG